MIATVMPAHFVAFLAVSFGCIHTQKALTVMTHWWLARLDRHRSRRFAEELEFVQCLANPTYVLRRRVALGWALKAKLICEQMLTWQFLLRHRRSFPEWRDRDNVDPVNFCGIHRACAHLSGDPSLLGKRPGKSARLHSGETCHSQAVAGCAGLLAGRGVPTILGVPAAPSGRLEEAKAQSRFRTTGFCDRGMAKCRLESD